jgi:hypothetical protein
MLLNGRNLSDFSTPSTLKLSKIDFSDYWISRKRILNSFWKRWLADYLEELMCLQKMAST